MHTDQSLFRSEEDNRRWFTLSSLYCVGVVKAKVAYLLLAHNAHIFGTILASWRCGKSWMRTIQLLRRRRLTCLRRVKLSMARLLLPLGKVHPTFARLQTRWNLLAYARHWLLTRRIPTTEFSFWIYSKRVFSNFRL